MNVTHNNATNIFVFDRNILKAMSWMKRPWLCAHVPCESICVYVLPLFNGVWMLALSRLSRVCNIHIVRIITISSRIIIGVIVGFHLKLLSVDVLCAFFPCTPNTINGWIANKESYTNVKSMEKRSHIIWYHFVLFDFTIFLDSVRAGGRRWIHLKCIQPFKTSQICQIQ